MDALTKMSNLTADQVAVRMKTFPVVQAMKSAAYNKMVTLQNALHEAAITQVA
jgi:hypothetical protein